MSGPVGGPSRQPAEAFIAQMRELAADDETFVGIVPCVFVFDGEPKQSVAWATAEVFVAEVGRNVCADDILADDDPGLIAALGALGACAVARDNAQALGAQVVSA